MKVYLYTLNTLADWEIAYITAELNSRRFLDNRKTPPELVFLGNTLEPIKTMGGIRITPDTCVDRVIFQEGDLLILPGAETWMDEENKKIVHRIPELLQQNVIVAAICGATFALAKNGILNDKGHTSNDLGYLKMICPEYTGENHYRNQPAAVDDNLITASGVAPLEFSYEVFKKIGVMKTETLEAWYQFLTTKETKYFFALMESLK